MVLSLGSYLNYPKLVDVKVGNWVTLQRCPSAMHFGGEVPHEPYASFTFLTAWPYDERIWQIANDTDQAMPLHEWHDAVIRESWMELPASERDAVERWRDRTYRHYNPIDCGPDMPQPKYIKKTSDLAAFFAGTL